MELPPKPSLYHKPLLRALLRLWPSSCPKGRSLLELCPHLGITGVGAWHCHPGTNPSQQTRASSIWLWTPPHMTMWGIKNSPYSMMGEQ